MSALDAEPITVAERSPLTSAIAAMAEGEMVAVVDAATTGAMVVVAAQQVTARHVNFMAQHARGPVGVVLTAERCDALALPALDRGRLERSEPWFTATVDAAVATAGASAADRALTIRTAADPGTTAASVVLGGQVGVTRAAAAGTPVVADAAVALARLAGAAPAAAACPILDHDGALAHGAALRAFCDAHDLPLVAAHDVIDEALGRIERVVSTTMPTRHGVFDAVGYRAAADGREHLALVHGVVAGLDEIPVHVHEQCLVGDALHGVTCDCGPTLERVLDAIVAEGRGVVIYVASPAGERDEAIVAQVLADLGVASIRRLENGRAATHAPRPGR